MSLEEPSEDLKLWVSECSGHPEPEVVAAIEAGGGVWRIVQRDGKPYFVTRDVHYQRVNLVIEGGIVKEAYFG